MNKRVAYDRALMNVKAEVEGQSDACFDTKAKLENPFFDAWLPEEILEKIFLNLDDSKDVQAVCNATPQFRRIVKPTMPVWTIDQIFPLVFSQLDKKDILQCRVVCKKWNSTVDNHVQNRPQHSGLIPYPYHPTQTRATDDPNCCRNHPVYRPEWHSTLYSKKLFGITLSSVNQIEQISEDLHAATSNPFVTRSVTFTNSDFDEEGYWYHALNFLEKFGKHIWHAEVAPEALCPQFNYQVVQKALCCMPNIRTFVLSGYVDGLSGDGYSLRRYIQEHPLPSLPHLHTIKDAEMTHKNKFGQLLVDEILQRYSGQLGTLITTVRTDLPPRWNTLTRMTALRLCMYRDTYQSWEHFLDSSSAPHLAKLSLSVSGFQTVSISKLLKPLQNAFPSLVYLHIWFFPIPYSRINKCCGEPILVMENLKTLKVNDHPNLQFDGFLSFFPALEYVVVSHKYNVPVHCDVDDEREMEIRLLMRNRSMYKSDIWTRIKTLKEFTLATYGDPDTGFDDNVERQFTRNGYDRFVGDEL